MEKVHLGPWQHQDQSQCSEFLLHFKGQSFGAHRQLLSGLSPHPGSLDCTWLLSISGSSGCLCVEPAWPWAHMVACSQERACEFTSGSITRWARESFFVPLGLYLLGFGTDQELSQNNWSTSQTFACFGCVHLSTNTFFPQAPLTGPFHLPLVPFWHLWCMFLPSPGPTPDLVVERGAFFYPFILLTFVILGAISINLSSFLHTHCKNLALLPSWLMRETSQHSDWLFYSNVFLNVIKGYIYLYVYINNV